MGKEAGITGTIDGFSQYADRRAQQLTNLGRFFGEALPIVADLEGCNSRLIEVGRPDLVMSERAEMKKITTVDSLLHEANNFTPDFEMITGVVEVGPARGNFPPQVQGIPITAEELYQRRSEGFPDDRHMRLSHASKPAFHRILALFPEFTVPLVVSLSQIGANYHDERFEPELFVAYQLMSQLVDVHDKNVVEKGRVNSFYLCA